MKNITGYGRSIAVERNIIYVYINKFKKYKYNKRDNHN